MGSLTGIFEHIRAGARFRQVEEALAARSRIDVSGLTRASKSLFISLLLGNPSMPALLITPTIAHAESIHDDLSFFLTVERSELLELFSERDTLDEKNARFPRMRVLERLARHEPLFIIAPLKALLQKIQDEESLREQILTLNVKETYPQSDICTTLMDRGYERTSLIEKRGEFSLRGCILDIYPTTGDPVRLEFWGDEIESIKNLDISTQRSRVERTSLMVLPVRDVSTTTSLLEYLPESAPILIDEPSHTRLQSLELGSDGELIPWEELEKNFLSRKIITISSWSEEEIHFNTSVMEPFYGKMDTLLEHLRLMQERSWRTIIISSQAARLREIFGEHAIRYALDANSPVPGEIAIQQGYFSEGFFMEPDLAIVTDREIVGTAKRIRSISPEKKQIPIKLEDLSAGTHVVHVLHGIGIYKGLVTLRIHGICKEFLCVEYSRGDKLYVPIEQMDLIQKFNYIEHKTVHLSRLGGKEWVNTRTKVKNNVREVARHLLELYARRDTEEGFRFAPDTPWQSELAESGRSTWGG